MLPPWIIDEIRKREQERDNQRPVVRVPLDDPGRRHPPDQSNNDEDEPSRGVVTIDLVPQDDEDSDSDGSVEIDIENMPEPETDQEENDEPSE